MPIDDTPFAEAIDFLKSKVNVPTRTFTDLSGAHHARAFTVAGAMKLSLLQDLSAAVLKHQEAGTTHKEFIKDWERITKAHGFTKYTGAPHPEREAKLRKALAKSRAIRASRVPSRL